MVPFTQACWRYGGRQAKLYLALYETDEQHTANNAAIVLDLGATGTGANVAATDTTFLTGTTKSRCGALKIHGVCTEVEGHPLGDDGEPLDEAQALSLYIPVAMRGDRDKSMEHFLHVGVQFKKYGKHVVSGPGKDAAAPVPELCNLLTPFFRAEFSQENPWFLLVGQAVSAKAAGDDARVAKIDAMAAAAGMTEGAKDSDRAAAAAVHAVATQALTAACPLIVSTFIDDGGAALINIQHGTRTAA